MHSILTTYDHIVRRVTIHYGPGRSVTPGRIQESHDWPMIEQRLNEDNRYSNFVVDYFEDAAGKNHPRVAGQLFDGIDVIPDINDRLHSATVCPIPRTVWFDDQTDPRTVHMLTNKFKLLVKRNDLNWSASIAAIVTLDLHTGKLTITR
jgi:hypothetical protein